MRVLRDEGFGVLVNDVDVFPFAEDAEVVQGRVDKVFDSAGLGVFWFVSERVSPCDHVERKKESVLESVFPLLLFARLESLRRATTKTTDRRRTFGKLTLTASTTTLPHLASSDFSALAPSPGINGPAKNTP